MDTHWGFGFTNSEMEKIQEVCTLLQERYLVLEKENPVDAPLVKIAYQTLTTMDKNQPSNKIYPREKVLFWIYSLLANPGEGVYAQIEEWCFTMGYFEKTK